MTPFDPINRRKALAAISAAAGAGLCGIATPGALAAKKPFALRYSLASAMYGTAALSDILPEAKKTGARSVTIWPKVHGDQREQIEAMGHDAFITMMKKHQLHLGAIACYKLGPFGLQDEMRFAQKIANQLDGGEVVLITGGKGPRDLKGAELKSAVKTFAEQLKPHAAVAAQTGCAIAIENHGNNLIDSPDSMRWLAEMIDTNHVGIAFAPHHLSPQHLPLDGVAMATLARDLGPAVRYVYAQQHGMGSSEKLPKPQELLQMPGRGDLDFGPLIQALKDTNYTHLTEILMHPTPRGIPILDSTANITQEINRARRYLNQLI